MEGVKAIKSKTQQGPTLTFMLFEELSVKRIFRGYSDIVKDAFSDVPNLPALSVLICVTPRWMLKRTF